MLRTDLRLHSTPPSVARESHHVDGHAASCQSEELRAATVTGRHGVEGDVGVQLKPAEELQATEVRAAFRAADVKETAARGLSGPAQPLPHQERIQASFGRHGLSHVQAFVGGEAAQSCGALGAEAYATGASVAFRSEPTVRTAAHEAAHVVQQQQGVQLNSGRGRPGDAYERHADAVAVRVAAGQSAVDLLDNTPSGGIGAGQAPVQCVDLNKKAKDKAESITILEAAPFGAMSDWSEGKVKLYTHEDFKEKYDDKAEEGRSWADLVAAGNGLPVAFELKGKVYVDAEEADKDTIAHELLHANAASDFYGFAGAQFSEGVTQHLTAIAFEASGLTATDAYPGQVGVVEKVLETLNESDLLTAFFVKGNVETILTAWAEENILGGRWDSFRALLDEEAYSSAKSSIGAGGRSKSF